MIILELKIEICPFCGKTMNAYSKKRHLLTHTSDIKCKICHEKFNTHEELEIHTRKHEENPNYRMSRKKNIRCETCNRCFANVQDYGHHICKHYDCDLCEKQFLMKRNLEVHKKFHDGVQIFSCDLCEALFLKR
jgi:KRAB domain-containing zinc finger protein